jgi:hypothetical protein
MQQQSMLPAFAVSTKPSCRGPIRSVVCVNVAAVLSRGGCSIISDSYFLRRSFAVDLSVATKPLMAALTCRDSPRPSAGASRPVEAPARRTDHDRRAARLLGPADLQ